MALINYPLKEMTIKIVYYGPGLSGKTTTLKYVYNSLPKKKKGKIVTLSTEEDRTFFFDFLPVDAGKIGDFTARIQLYTVPGQVFYENTRRMVLQGADAVIFVADSQESMMEANKESMSGLFKNLKVNNIDATKIPIVMAYNKRDLKNISPVSQMNNELNQDNYEFFETSAIYGDGILETLNTTISLAIKSVKKRYRFDDGTNREETVVFDRDELLKEEQKMNEKSDRDEDEIFFGFEKKSKQKKEPLDEEIMNEQETLDIDSIEEIDPLSDSKEIIDDKESDTKFDKEEDSEILELDEEEIIDEDEEIIMEENMEDNKDKNNITDDKNMDKIIPDSDSDENIFSDKDLDDFDEDKKSSSTGNNKTKMFGQDSNDFLNDFKNSINIKILDNIESRGKSIIIPLNIEVKGITKKIKLKIDLSIID